jgi:type I restriction enzyme M protein
LGWKREALKARVGDLFAFINTELLPYLHRLDTLPDGRPNLLATPRQRVIGRIMTAVERVRVDSETDFANILDLVHQISIDHIDDRHFFTLSQVYEDLLLKMGEKNSDGGQFFTPREVVRAMVHTLAPSPARPSTTPAAPAAFWPRPTSRWPTSWAISPPRRRWRAEARQLLRPRKRTWSSRSRWPIWCSTASTSPTCGTATRSPGADLRRAVRGGPATFDVILTNPPFGGKEGKDAQKNYSFESSSTQVLFMQHILKELKPALDGQPGGRCGVVLDEGLLFRTNESAFVETSASSSTSASCGPSSACPAGCSRPPGRASRPTCCSSPKAARPSGSGTTTCRA